MYFKIILVILINGGCFFCIPVCESSEVGYFIKKMNEGRHRPLLPYESVGSTFRHHIVV